jgi:hypothetical protein
MNNMNILKNYSLSIILAGLFIISWLLQGVFQWAEFVSNQAAHNQEVQTSDFINEFIAATMENWQSEFLQLFSFVLLSTYFIHKHSPQSRDGEDRVEQSLSRIEKALKIKK